MSTAIFQALKPEYILLIKKDRGVNFMVKRDRMYKFTVMGKTSTFPVDMLRYDSCKAATPEDEEILNRSLPKEEFVPSSKREVVEINFVSSTPPTVGRWSSFGWGCSEGIEL
jgi:hypothetical protein